ncbi:MAG: alpha-glucosidase C-terminal domain-containing protein [Acidobacteria bacterium]|nr:alpha-glucosidase C-terminal domain-containing protein [Acidobacteriota bacterium]
MIRSQCNPMFRLAFRAVPAVAVLCAALGWAGLAAGAPVEPAGPVAVDKPARPVATSGSRPEKTAAVPPPAAAPAATPAPATDFVPAWAREAVWYQIFPERFRNGDPGNDPRVEDQDGAYPHDITSPWQLHPWTADWYALQPYERKNGKDIWYNLQRRRYGGDLQGVLDRLDYLQRLGVNALYLNPVFDSPSSHKYDGCSWHHVDPTFGPDPAGDRKRIAAEDPADPKTWAWTAADRLLLKLVREVHRRGMRLILDGVFNHLSTRSWPFRDLVKRGKASPYADWFNVTDWDQPGPLGVPFSYAGWFGVAELPEIRQDEGGTVEGPRRYVFACTRRWMDPDGDGDPSDGIDGWRLDVAFCIRHPFWKAWRTLVKSVNPRAYLVAEVVDTPAATAPYVQGDEFDAVMNYNFTFACWQFFIEGPRRIDAKAFDTQLRTLREAFPPCVGAVAQNLLDSHDSTRMASHVVNGPHLFFEKWGEYYGLSKGDNPRFDTRRPTADERKLQLLAVAFLMTYPGAPMVYYGDEAGMWGANDPCCRKPMVWDDLRYAPEAVLPGGGPRPKADPVAFDRAVFETFRELIRLRRAHPALREGDFRALRAGDDGVYAFSRAAGGERVVVVLNRDAEARTVTLEGVSGRFRELYGPRGPAPRVSGGKLTLTVPARSARILCQAAGARSGK